MKLALVSDHASPLGALGGADAGGQNVYVGHLARHLAARGHTVDVLTRRDSAHLPEVVEWQPGVRVVHVPAGPPEPVRKEALLPWMLEFTGHTVDWCRRESYDLLHANFWMSGLAAAEVKHTLGTPFVITFHALGRVRRLHQGDVDEFPDARFTIEEELVATADRVIAECPQDADDLTQLYLADEDRITIIPCGVDPEEFFPVERATARHAVGLPATERIVLHLGRLVPRKGVDLAIRGVARLLRDHGVAARLVIVGGEADEPDPIRTPEIGRLRAVAAEEGISDRVLFTGRRGRDHLRYYYSAADVFVTTPWYEPFGMTPLEAMACGTPVVGAAVGGLRYTILDGQTGYLVPAHDADAVAERVARLCRDGGLRRAMGAQAIEHVTARFTWRRVAAQVEALYSAVARAARARRPEVRGGRGGRGRVRGRTVIRAARRRRAHGVAP